MVGETRLITVVETGLFTRQAERIWTEEELGAIVDYVARNPEAGDVIPGSGGVRKLRWGRVGSGKRGGARVIYLHHSAEMPIYFLLAYAKARTSDMTADEKKMVSALATTLKQQAAGRRTR